MGCPVIVLVDTKASTLQRVTATTTAAPPAIVKCVALFPAGFGAPAAARVCVCCRTSLTLVGTPISFRLSVTVRWVYGNWEAC